MITLTATLAVPVDTHPQHDHVRHDVAKVEVQKNSAEQTPVLACLDQAPGDGAHFDHARSSHRVEATVGEEKRGDLYLRYR